MTKEDLELPWSVRRSSGNSTVVQLGKDNLVSSFQIHPPEKAEFLVKAANAHHDLLAAVQDTWELAQDVSEMSAEDARYTLITIQQIVGAAIVKAGQS